MNTDGEIGPLRMVPANERLDARDAVAAGIDDRLVEEIHLSLRERIRQSSSSTRLTVAARSRSLEKKRKRPRPLAFAA
jgi:hypothetical protein